MQLSANEKFSNRVGVGIYSRAQQTFVRYSSLNYHRVAYYGAGPRSHVHSNHLCAGSNFESTSWGGGVVPNIVLKRGTQVGSFISDNYVDNGFIQWETQDHLLKGLQVINNVMITHAPGSYNDGTLNYITRQVPNGPTWGNDFSWVRLQYPTLAQNSSPRVLKDFKFTGNAPSIGKVKEGKVWHRVARLVGVYGVNTIATLQNVDISRNTSTVFLNPADFIHGIPFSFAPLQYPLQRSATFTSKSSVVVPHGEVPFGCTPKTSSNFTLLTQAPGRATGVAQATRSVVTLDKNHSGNIKFQVTCEGN
jgi:hypothetical protein